MWDSEFFGVAIGEASAESVTDLDAVVDRRFVERLDCICLRCNATTLSAETATRGMASTDGHDGAQAGMTSLSGSRLGSG
jgi:hypothetical protein